MENNEKLGLSLCYKLINTLNAKSFRKSLASLWQGAAASDNVFAVNNKACSELQRKIDMFERHDIAIVYSYLDSLATEQEIKLKLPTKKDLFKALVSTPTAMSAGS